MTHTIKKAITVLSMVIFGSILLYNCEPDADSLGEQLFLDGAAQGVVGVVGATQQNRQVRNLEQVGSLERGKPSSVLERCRSMVTMTRQGRHQGHERQGA
jgi:hypothetical protein